MLTQKYNGRHIGPHHFLRRTAAALLGLSLAGSFCLGAGPSEGGQKFRRFRLELMAGYALLDPADLNLLSESNNRFREFSYEAYYDYLRQNNLLQSWSKEGARQRPTIHSALLPGLRLKYFLFDFLAVSAGFQYLRGGGSHDLTITYTRNELSGERYIETLTAAPYQLSVEAALASIGLHFSKKIGRFLRAEGFLAVGPLWAVCRTKSSWTYAWVIRGPNYVWTPFDSTGLLEMDGSGRGFFWETGARLELPVASGIRSFLEGGYARQVVDSVSGSGRELQGQSNESWEGKWHIQKETVTAPWGTLDLRTPSNRQRAGVETERFRLDLSGFRLRLGLSLGF